MYWNIVTEVYAWFFFLKKTVYSTFVKFSLQYKYISMHVLISKPNAAFLGIPSESLICVGVGVHMYVYTSKLQILEK